MILHYLFTRYIGRSSPTLCLLHFYCVVTACVRFPHYTVHTWCRASPCLPLHIHLGSALSPWIWFLLLRGGDYLHLTSSIGQVMILDGPVEHHYQHSPTPTTTACHPPPAPHTPLTPHTTHTPTDDPHTITLDHCDHVGPYSLCCLL